MKEKSIIIIGGGLAGLSTGLYGQKNGFDTHIFEYHNLPGGMCTAWHRNGFTIDGCIHWLMGANKGSEMYQIYEEVGALENNPLIPLTEYVTFIHEETGRSVRFNADLEQLRKDMLDLAPEDRPRIDHFMSLIDHCRSFQMPVLKPSELRTPLETARVLWSLRGIIPRMPLLMKPVTHFAETFKNPKLANMLKYMFVPEMPLMFATILMAQLAQGNLAGYRGGSLEFSKRVEQRYLSLGGRITYRARVDQILVENNRAVGVKLQDGTQHRADLIISACDGYSTIYHMLNGKYISKQIQEIYDSWPRFSPINLVTFGVNSDLGGGSRGKAVFLDRSVNIGGGGIQGFHFRTFNFDPSLSPSGKNIVQAIVQADWDYWSGLSEDKERYLRAKQLVAEQVQKLLEPHVPGLKGNVEMVDVATPTTFNRYTLVQKGWYEGFLFTPKAMKSPPPKTLPGLSGFQMVGQWVEPGGGIPPALFGGRQLIMRLCHQQKRPFVAL